VFIFLSHPPWPFATQERKREKKKEKGITRASPGKPVTTRGRDGRKGRREKEEYSPLRDDSSRSHAGEREEKKRKKGAVAPDGAILLDQTRGKKRRGKGV